MLEREVEDLEKIDEPELESVMKNDSVETLFVNQFTDGILNPEHEMLGPVRDGGTIIANLAPGNWGPMITPEIRGGYEVTRPIYIEGAEIGDAIIVKIQSIQVTSFATASGTKKELPDRYIEDPYINVKCPGCGKLHPNTYISNIGKQSIRCATCHTEIVPFEMTNGYTMIFDHQNEIGVTINRSHVRKIATEPEQYMRIPENSVQHPIVTYMPTDLSGVVARMRPFISQIGTMPSIAMPDYYNAGDVGNHLINKHHEFSLTKEQLKRHCTDGNLGINRIREGAILLCPVKVRGGGLYLGGLQAMQGDGAVASASTDVSGIVQLQVFILKKVHIEGPILISNMEDLPYTVKPLTKKERQVAKDLGEDYGIKQVEGTFPLSFIGTGENVNVAIDNAIVRAANFLEYSIDEVKNRATITGSTEIGRLPGVVILSLQVPKSILKKKEMYKLVKQQYRM